MIGAFFSPLLTDRNMQHILAAEKNNTKGLISMKKRRKTDKNHLLLHFPESEPHFRAKV